MNLLIHNNIKIRPTKICKYYETLRKYVSENISNFQGGVILFDEVSSTLDIN